jgi:hypothetical protein
LGLGLFKKSKIFKKLLREKSDPSNVTTGRGFTSSNYFHSRGDVNATEFFTYGKFSKILSQMLATMVSIPDPRSDMEGFVLCLNQSQLHLLQFRDYEKEASV